MIGLLREVDVGAEGCIRCATAWCPSNEHTRDGLRSDLCSHGRSVSGSITTSGISGTAAHIHMAPAGQNGPVIVSLTRTADNMWSVPPGVRLTDAQYDAFKQGNLYVNVHSAAIPSGRSSVRWGSESLLAPSKRR